MRKVAGERSKLRAGTSGIGVKPAGVKDRKFTNSRVSFKNDCKYID